MCLCVFFVVLRIAQRVMAWARCCALLDGKPWFAHAGGFRIREKNKQQHTTRTCRTCPQTHRRYACEHTCTHTHTHIYIYIYRTALYVGMRARMQRMLNPMQHSCTYTHQDSDGRSGLFQPRSVLASADDEVAKNCRHHLFKQNVSTVPCFECSAIFMATRMASSS